MGPDQSNGYSNGLDLELLASFAAVSGKERRYGFPQGLIMRLAVAEAGFRVVPLHPAANRRIEPLHGGFKVYLARFLEYVVSVRDQSSGALGAASLGRRAGAYFACQRLDNSSFQ